MFHQWTQVVMRSDFIGTEPEEEAEPLTLNEAAAIVEILEGVCLEVGEDASASAFLCQHVLALENKEVLVKHHVTGQAYANLFVRMITESGAEAQNILDAVAAFRNAGPHDDVASGLSQAGLIAQTTAR